MCGILGQIRLQTDIIRDSNKFRAALNSLTHRGPDGGDIHYGDEFVFGHRRLNIIDLTQSASQPMKSDDGRMVITFNGEIYNFRELREELLVRGYHFRSTGDTEVLLKGIHCFGIDFIKRCNGEFALGIYDTKTKDSYIVRDRLGIKPLYYTLTNGRITFASEIKAILQFEEINRRLNMAAVSSYLSYRYPILNDTFFEGIFSLAPGHYLQVSKGNVSTHCFWDPREKFAQQQVDHGEEYYISELRTRLESAVKYRMISDVPVGAYLSGGVDSSIVTMLMAKNSNKAVESFTVGYNDADFNEFNYARLIADKFKTNHHELLRSGSDYFELIEQMIGQKDAPLSIPNEVPQYELSKELKKFVTVVLSGNGADEIFCGYGRIFRSPDDLNRLKSLAAEGSNSKNDFARAFEKKYGTTHFDSELEHFVNIYSYTNLATKKTLLHKSIDLDSIEVKFIDRFRKQFDSLEGDTYLNKMIYAFERIHLPGILMHQDNATMAASVECRVPFIDHNFVEFAFTVPSHYKLRWNSAESKIKASHLMSDKISEVLDTPKYLLKKAYETEIPDEVLYRKKMGFPVPLLRWFGGEFRNQASDLLLSARAQARGLYNNESITQWLNDGRLEQSNADAMKIWMLVNLEIFIRKYFD
jgi:asparagine synthase (glutamine-hydrolysing)